MFVQMRPSHVKDSFQGGRRVTVSGLTGNSRSGDVRDSLIVRSCYSAGFRNLWALLTLR